MDVVAVLITGGARSGKSRFAEQLAAHRYKRGIYIATSEALDQEMADRIAKHQAERAQSGFSWQTLEEPLHLSEALHKLATGQQTDMEQTVVLVDCLTLWLSNWFFMLDVEHQGSSKLHAVVLALAEQVRNYPYPLIIVSNELGDGIVPADALSRSYRDEAGRLNQAIAEHCEQVFLVTAGIPVDLKRIAYRWEEQ
ncbi:bifunctional adenosylcobinamide kinase/adenosylcobinamide-phosphate guanylyltransferase [Paenibacillus montaniterrae]|uniref:bifunctional adenosylcobinamide kinase/adenosylcobinamide-phosphate guanylyltransferase n=1 Tax=Paenibacillus montaniterrae TaxID=429341 RepID=UPI002796369E|nr:bifunctional adenosylcobinamide kinase/adenosylcobinamide-phosphate guanylyltransferase [Paenibacillus montaniterrae]